jgi:hypothetical protein
MAEDGRVSNPTHSAAASALGYLYQSQWPLVEIVRRSSDRPDLEMAIELYDDVSWEEGGTPLELLQLKHHLNSTRALGDKDADLWRTIASWMDAHPPDDADGPTLTLVTTQAAATGTACAALGSDIKDAVEAQRLLELAARESTADATSAARTRFLGLTDAQRAIFVGRMVVLHGACEIGDLDAELRKLLRIVLPLGHEDVFIDRLWAWWYRVVVGLLQGTARTIGALEVVQHISDLRDQFTTDNLPTLVDRDDFDPTNEGTYSGRAFVEQLRWISFTNTLLQKAIVDYYRAFTQSARWIEDHLVGLNELDAFEDNLKDEWERAFEFMVLRLGNDATPDRIASEGQALFRQVTEQSQVRVRDRYNEGFFTRGKYHELADDGRVGWHPEFEERLKQLLLGQAS